MNPKEIVKRSEPITGGHMAKLTEAGNGITVATVEDRERWGAVPWAPSFSSAR